MKTVSRQLSAVSENPDFNYEKHEKGRADGWSDPVRLLLDARFTPSQVNAMLYPEPPGGRDIFRSRAKRGVRKPIFGRYDDFIRAGAGTGSSISTEQVWWKRSSLKMSDQASFSLSCTRFGFRRDSSPKIPTAASTKCGCRA